jgi:predicted porin
VNQIFNPRFQVIARAGVEYRSYTSANDNPGYFGPAGELAATYDYKKFSNVSLNMRYSTEQSGLNGAATRQTFRIGLNAIHGLTPKLSFNAGLNYLNNYYNEFDQSDFITPQPNFYENIIEFTIGANFKLNDNIVLQAGFARTVDMAPASEQLSYQRNVYFVGLNSNF